MRGLQPRISSATYRATVPPLLPTAAPPRHVVATSCRRCGCRRVTMAIYFIIAALLTSGHVLNNGHAVPSTPAELHVPMSGGRDGDSSNFITHLSTAFAQPGALRPPFLVDGDVASRTRHRNRALQSMEGTRSSNAMCTDTGVQQNGFGSVDCSGPTTFMATYETMVCYPDPNFPAESSQLVSCTNGEAVMRYYGTADCSGLYDESGPTPADSTCMSPDEPDGYASPTPSPPGPDRRSISTSAPWGYKGLHRTTWRPHHREQHQLWRLRESLGRRVDEDRLVLRRRHDPHGGAVLDERLHGWLHGHVA